MQAVVGFIVGALAASVAWFFIARNNKKKVTEILNLDPKATWDQIRSKIRAKI